MSNLLICCTSRGLFNVDLSLEGRTYIVAGASSGLGEGVTQLLMQEGASVLAVSRRGVPSNLHIALKPEQSLVDLRANLETSEGLASLTEAACDLDEVSGVICVLGNGAPSTGTLVANFEQSYARNLKPVLGILDAVSHKVEKSNESGIVLISSIAGVEVIDCPLEYAASKTAIHPYVAHLARSLAPIRVIALAPGNMLTAGSVWERRMSDDPLALTSHLSRLVPLKRLATPLEVARTAVFLVSPASSFTTGTVVVVDGGQTSSW